MDAHELGERVPSSTPPEADEDSNTRQFSLTPADRGAPLAIPLVSRYPQYRKLMIWLGWPLCLLGLVAGSFAQTLEVLILTQGVLYGLGFITFYYPILSMVNEWWIDRRGLAYAIMCSASGFSGAVMPFVTQALLDRYGYATTLRAIAAGLLVVTGPLIPMLRGRLPEAAVSSHPRTDWTFVRSTRFWIYSLSNVAMGLGYFFPSLYLPSYAVSNGLNPTQGALLLAVMSVSQALGLFCFGYMSDRRIPVDVLTITSPLVAAVAVYTCWGLASTLPVMLVFAMVYGFFGSGYTATWARIGTSISSDPIAAFTAFGTLNLGKGLGNVLTGPIGGALVGSDTVAGAYGAVKYQKVVLFTGSCMLLSGATILLYRAKDLKLATLVSRLSKQDSH
ncbi:hypothetical protein AMS68_002236 [Peltaster fructicola]|uniref:Major facilitator superfamily (MFS) profile domain-containing protein n=1 Tax=Peltaster fructicola TaxID=286661 RepID=A0A6H0XQ19_9PEZI|nr:hypothetical protein AMS68_002236 [Peltaster fructicola]